jgi:hypothetical protein
MDKGTVLQIVSYVLGGLAFARLAYLTFTQHPVLVGALVVSAGLYFIGQYLKK